ncbi:MarR family winged helix-turn-helix transcriptional regulator [Maribacter sp. 2-571]|uniref:MarR family winged helix-turn-helix transcriptional regulator n=1 Tax=Maribacter sp. 2-571 TaxID=3417569 RepID=UPI003D334EDE
MSESLFDPAAQNGNLPNKIVAGLEKVSEAFKVLLWDKGKELGLSPIQIQLLLFVAYHGPEFCTVSNLAKEFNVTKPTISDVVRVLLKKQLIQKDYSNSDSRSYVIFLTDSGEQMVEMTKDFANPIKKQLSRDAKVLQPLFHVLSRLMYGLSKDGVLGELRICYGCRFYVEKKGSSYCNLLERTLRTNDIRIDCKEYESQDQ